MALRVDTSRIALAEYIADLAAAGISGHAVGWVPAAIQLECPVAVAALPGFKEGRVSVQDAGAQLAAELLNARGGMRVLDACAAPGGKTSHLLERAPDLAELLAVDIDSERAKRIHSNLKRLKRHARVVVADVREPQSFWDGKYFDRVLVDAPCSSTGVIRRHPDIKLLRRAADIPALAATQLAILQACFSMLAPGGLLVYGSCSVLPAENEQVVDRLLEAEPQAKAIAAVAIPPGAIRQRRGFQLLPGAAAGADGFYYACLEKTTTGT
jgi:16S rRNA (cytosine967-C5)-methyltransferase